MKPWLPLLGLLAAAGALWAFDAAGVGPRWSPGWLIAGGAVLSVGSTYSINTARAAWDDAGWSFRAVENLAAGLMLGGFAFTLLIAALSSKAPG